MTDRPIIQTAADVRAALAGRKTQARVILKPWRGLQSKWLSMDTLHRAPTCYVCEVDGRLGAQMQHPLAGTDQSYGHVDAMSPLGWVRLPYSPGDRLWVREAHTFQDLCDGECLYRATIKDDTDYDAEEIAQYIWRPSTQMPRWASRLTYIVTDVRVQRLQDISEADAIAEGIKLHGDFFTGYGKAADQWMGPLDSFASLWISLHGYEGWDENPWVVALTFTVQRGNIDQMPGVAG